MTSQISRQEAAKELLRRRTARKSLLTCTEYLSPKYSAAGHHKVIAEQLDRVLRGEIDRLMLLVPPRHGKSELASRNFPAFALGHKPDWQVISASATATLAEDFGRDVRNIVASSEYQNLFETKLAEDSQAKGRWGTNEGGSYYAVGIGGALMGRGAHLLVIDDPFASMADAQSERKREEVWNWYAGTAYNRLMPGGAIVVINHRMHEDDLVGRLLKKQEDGGDRWEVVNLPAIKDGEALWPEWYPIDRLERIKANTPPREWSALYMQNPTPEDGTFFKREWFKFYKSAPISVNKYLSSDFGVTEDSGDATEIGIHGIAHTGDLYACIDGWGGQKAADAWIDEYLTLVQRHKTLCEFNEAGVIRRSIEPFLVKRRRERNIGGRCEWIAPVGDKAARARSLQAMASMGRVWLPDNDYGRRVLTDLLKFPTSADDHTVDMLSLMARALDQSHPGVVAKQEPTKPRDRWDAAFDDEDEDSWRTA